MNRLLYHFLLFGLVLGALVLSTEQSNTVQHLRFDRPERGLEDNEIIHCAISHCPESREISQAVTAYSISLASSAYLSLEIIPDDNKGWAISFELLDPSQSIQLYLEAHRPPSRTTMFTQDFSLSQQKQVITVPAPIERVYINFQNRDSEAALTLTISRDDSGSSNYVNKSKSDFNSLGALIAGVIAAVIVIAIISLCCYQYCQRRHRNRYASNSENSQPRQPGDPEESQALTHDAIDTNYPGAEFDQFESSFPQKICTICLEEMKAKQPCRQLDCQHIFHDQCAKLWLQNQLQKMRKACCPNCNQSVKMLKSQRSLQ